MRIRSHEGRRKQAEEKRQWTEEQRQEQVKERRAAEDRALRHRFRASPAPTRPPFAQLGVRSESLQRRRKRRDDHADLRSGHSFVEDSLHEQALHSQRQEEERASELLDRTARPSADMAAGPSAEWVAVELRSPEAKERWRLAEQKVHLRREADAVRSKSIPRKQRFAAKVHGGTAARSDAEDAFYKRAIEAEKKRHEEKEAKKKRHEEKESAELTFRPEIRRRRSGSPTSGVSVVDRLLYDQKHKEKQERRRQPAPDADGSPLALVKRHSAGSPRCSWMVDSVHGAAELHICGGTGQRRSPRRQLDTPKRGGANGSPGSPSFSPQISPGSRKHGASIPPHAERWETAESDRLAKLAAKRRDMEEVGASTSITADQEQALLDRLAASRAGKPEEAIPFATPRQAGSPRAASPPACASPGHGGANRHTLEGKRQRAAEEPQDRELVEVVARADRLARIEQTRVESLKAESEAKTKLREEDRDAVAKAQKEDADKEKQDLSRSLQEAREWREKEKAARAEERERQAEEGRQRRAQNEEDGRLRAQAAEEERRELRAEHEGKLARSILTVSFLYSQVLCQLLDDPDHSACAARR